MSVARRGFLKGLIGLSLLPELTPADWLKAQAARRPLRYITDLTGPWEMQLDPYDEGSKVHYFVPRFNRDNWTTVSLPCTFNQSLPGMDGYRGICWFSRSFQLPVEFAKRPVFLCFQGVNYYTTVWVNGTKLIENKDPFLPFEVRLPASVRPGTLNNVTVRVDSLRAKGELPTFEGWFPDGGILREVWLEARPELQIGTVKSKALLRNGGGDFSLTMSVSNLSDSPARASMRVKVRNPEGGEAGALVSNPVDIPAGQTTQIDVARFFPDAKTWSPDSPALHAADISLLNDGQEVDRWHQRFGFRSIDVREGTLRLNGQPLFLTGFNRHEDSPRTGMAMDLGRARQDFQDMRQAGCNFVRLCHYPHHPGELDLCDEIGLLVLSEIPLILLASGRRFAVGCLVLLLMIAAASARGRIVRLENQKIAIQIDRDDGSISQMLDKELGEVYRFESTGFRVSLAGAVLKSERSQKQELAGTRLVLAYDYPTFTIDLVYELPAHGVFVEKWIDIKAKQPKSYFLEAVVLEEARSSSFREIHFHDDNTIWHCPISLFLRGAKGGCFAGIEYPYWDFAVEGGAAFRIGYKPNYEVPAGETHVSEKYFIGVFRKEGIRRYSQGPYPGKVEAGYLNWKGTGVSQHFPGDRIPPQAVEPESLDWGEVWAMQEFMRHVLPEVRLPEKGYWIWQNGWWAGLFKLETDQLDRLKAAGIRDVMTAHTWYGQGTHPMEERYLTNMSVDPPGFPLPQGPPSATGQYSLQATGFNNEVKNLGREYENPKEFELEFRAPKVFEDYIAYGRKIGVHVNSFALPGIYFEQRPDWLSVDKQGNPNVYIFGRRTSCPAGDDYMRFLLNLHIQVFEKYQPRWWGWDGRWMSHWEIALTRPGGKGAGPDPCFASNHGHLPGDNFYREWRNINFFLAELRRRFPSMCLEQYLGLKRGGPWALRYLNADDNYYETSGADMNRFQAWHNQNDRFRPPYKNYAAVFGESEQDFQLNVISAISATAYCQIGPGFKGLALAENRDFLKQWREWATVNSDYLKVKRDLFACPGYSPIDGSAHVIGDRGYIFLFPGGLGAYDPELRKRAAEPGKATRVSIPLNRWIGLKTDPGLKLRISEVYPLPGQVLGVYSYGEDLLCDVPRDSALVLAIEPASKQEKTIHPVLPRSTTIVKAF